MKKKNILMDCIVGPILAGLITLAMGIMVVKALL